MIRPIYRWKSFWLGLFVLGFLGWAWVRSMHGDDLLGWSLPSTGVGVHQYSGLVVVSHGEPYGVANKNPSGFWAVSNSSDFSAQVPWASWFQEITLFQRGAGDLRLPHWFLVLLFLVPWASFLGWRWRRERKRTEYMA